MIDLIAIALVMLVLGAIAYALGSPHFYGGDSQDITGVAFRSRYSPGVYGARIERGERSERSRRTWSYVGALALAGLGGLCLAAAARTPDIVVLVVAVVLLVSAAWTARTTRAGESYGSNAHLAGMAFAGVAVTIVVMVPGLMPLTWFVASIVLSFVAIVALGIGRS